MLTQTSAHDKRAMPSTGVLSVEKHSASQVPLKPPLLFIHLAKSVPQGSEAGGVGDGAATPNAFRRTASQSFPQSD